MKRLLPFFVLATALHAGLLDDIRTGRAITAIRARFAQSEAVIVHVWDASGSVHQQRTVKISDATRIAQIASLIGRAEVCDESFGMFSVSPPIEFVGPDGHHTVCVRRGRLFSVPDGGGNVMLRLSEQDAARFSEFEREAVNGPHLAPRRD